MKYQSRRSGETQAEARMRHARWETSNRMYPEHIAIGVVIALVFVLTMWSFS